jgi:xanthosine utilization system XapX-like protein
MKNYELGIVGGLVLGIIYGLISGFFLGFTISLIIGLICVFIALILLYLTRKSEFGNPLKNTERIFITAIIGSILGWYFSNYHSTSGETAGYAMLAYYVILGLFFVILILISLISLARGSKQENESIKEPTNWFFIIIILGLIIALGAIWFVQFKVLGECSMLTSQNSKDYCNSGQPDRNNVDEDKGLSKCDLIVSKEIRDECYYDAEQSINDPLLCPKIKEYFGNNDSRGVFCYMIIGWGIVGTGSVPRDASICEKISNSDEKFECYYIRASSYNLTLCNDMKDTSKIDSCIDKASQIKSKRDREELIHQCELQQEHWKDVCWRDLADSSKDLSICDKINDSQIKKYCLNPPLSCFDSDGEDYYTMGNVTSQSGNFTDTCMNPKIVSEFVCRDNGVYIDIQTFEYNCQKGCVNGACVK